MGERPNEPTITSSNFIDSARAAARARPPRHLSEADNATIHADLLKNRRTAATTSATLAYLNLDAPDSDINVCEVVANKARDDWEAVANYLRQHPRYRRFDLDDALRRWCNEHGLDRKDLSKLATIARQGSRNNLDAVVSPPPVTAPVRVRSRRRRPTRERGLTDKQKQAIEVVAKHGGNISAAARELNKTRQAVSETYRRATSKAKKLGMEMASRSVNTQRMPKDRRGQPTIPARSES
jgi:hypothetical protein